MFLLCHPWFTISNLSYRFPILETSATASCSTTGTLFKRVHYIFLGLPSNQSSARIFRTFPLALAAQTLHWPQPETGKESILASYPQTLQVPLTPESHSHPMCILQMLDAWMISQKVYVVFFHSRKDLILSVEELNALDVKDWQG